MYVCLKSEAEFENVEHKHKWTGSSKGNVF